MAKPVKVTTVPARLESFGQTGWTVFTFATPADAGAWVQANPQAAMPCWRRCEVIDGELTQVR